MSLQIGRAAESVLTFGTRELPQLVYGVLVSDQLELSEEICITKIAV